MFYQLYTENVVFKALEHANIFAPFRRSAIIMFYNAIYNIQYACYIIYISYYIIDIIFFPQCGNFYRLSANVGIKEHGSQEPEMSPEALALTRSASSKRRRASSNCWASCCLTCCRLSIWTLTSCNSFNKSLFSPCNLARCCARSLTCLVKSSTLFCVSRNNASNFSAAFSAACLTKNEWRWKMLKEHYTDKLNILQPLYELEWLGYVDMIEGGSWMETELLEYERERPPYMSGRKFLGRGWKT